MLDKINWRGDEGEIFRIDPRGRELWWSVFGGSYIQLSEIRTIEDSMGQQWTVQEDGKGLARDFHAVLSGQTREPGYPVRFLNQDTDREVAVRLPQLFSRTSDETLKRIIDEAAADGEE